MDELIKKAMDALQDSSFNEIEMSDAEGNKVRVVRFTPVVQYTVPVYSYQWDNPLTSGGNF